MADSGEGSSRRRLLRITAALGTPGVVGCLGDSDERRSTDRPAAEGPRPTRTVAERPTPTEDAGNPGWRSTLFALWRGTDPTRSTTLQWVEGASSEPAPTAVTLSPLGGGATTSVDTDVAALNETTEEPRGSESTVRVEGSGAGTIHVGLLRFEDVVGTGEGRIPPDADVESATLTLQTESAGSPATVHRMLHPWEEDVVWSDFGPRGVMADGETATGAVADVGGVQEGPTRIDVTGAVRAWAYGQPNHGLAVLASGGNEWTFASAEGGTPPRLEVTYDDTTVTFRDGQDGYSGAVDTYISGVRLPYQTLYRHRASFDGLEPDTEYAISVDGTAAGATVRTAPATLEEPITIAEGGDVGPSDDVPPLHDTAASWDPLVGVVGGDLAYANAHDEQDWITFLEDWSRHMRAGDRLIPIAAAIGNHELPQGMALHGTPEQAPYYYGLFDNTERDRAYWAIDVGEEVSILILDSNHTTDVAGEQTEWLEGALAEREDRQHVLPVYHVPAYPSATGIEGRERQDIRGHWVPLFEEYGVDVAFEHDDHTYKRTHQLVGGEPSEDGVLYLGDGAWGRYTREPKMEREYLATAAAKKNVIRVQLNPDGSKSFEAVGLDDETIDEYSLEPS